MPPQNLSQSQRFFSLPAQQDLKSAFLGKQVKDAPVPSVILDVAKIRRSCTEMLDAVNELQLSFRAHVKTHKTEEVTRLQVGETCKDVRLVVSTIIEAESLTGLLLEYKERGAKVNLLYGIPLGMSCVFRLVDVAKQLGPGSVSVIIDNVSQLDSVKKLAAETGHPPGVFVKTDSGYHRAGVLPDSSSMIQLLKHVSEAEQQHHLRLSGFYSHNSLSYGGSSPNDAMDMLKTELDVCRQASTHLSNFASRTEPLVISVGASPTALSIQNLRSSSEKATASTSSAQALRDTLDLTTSSFELEIHAGVYPVFDLQQVAASSRKFSSETVAHDAIALTVLAEVISSYPDRTSAPEVLVNAGCLALAREPCKSYPGFGVVTSWNMPASYDADVASNPKSRIMVSRISQEHGILGWQDTSKREELPLSYGQKIRLWPNHACITGAGFGWYLVVDSDSDDRGESVQDVWVRWRGW